MQTEDELELVNEVIVVFLLRMVTRMGRWLSTAHLLLTCLRHSTHVFHRFGLSPLTFFWDPTFGFHLTACGPAFFVVLFQDCGLPSVDSGDKLLTGAELLRPPISLELGPCNSSQIPPRAWVCF